MENNSNNQNPVQQNWQMPPASPNPPQKRNYGCMAAYVIIGIFALIVGILFLLSAKKNMDLDNAKWEEEKKQEEHYYNDSIYDGIVDSTGTVIYPARTKYEKYCYYDSMMNTLPYINKNDYQNTSDNKQLDSILNELDSLDELPENIPDEKIDSILNVLSHETAIAQQDTNLDAMPDSVKQIFQKREQYADSAAYYAPPFRRCGMGAGMAVLSVIFFTVPCFAVFVICLVCFLVMFFTRKKNN